MIKVAWRASTVYKAYKLYEILSCGREKGQTELHIEASLGLIISARMDGSDWPRQMFGDKGLRGTARIVLIVSNEIETNLLS